MATKETIGLLAGILLVSTVAAAETPTEKPHTRQLTKSNEAFLLDLKRKLEGRGFTGVRIMPQLFVAEGALDGQEMIFAVNSYTLDTVVINGVEIRRLTE